MMTRQHASITLKEARCFTWCWRCGVGVDMMCSSLAMHASRLQQPTEVAQTVGGGCACFDSGQTQTDSVTKRARTMVCTNDVHTCVVRSL
jgi:hypothetical protein